MNDNILIFTINGGAGKNVLATAVVKAIKESNPKIKIIVVTSYQEVWLYNPNVYRTYNFGNTPNFYNDFIKNNNNVSICALEPYTANDYILKKKHLIEVWCDLAGVKYKGEKPELFFNQREVELFENTLGNDGRPILAIQTNGGGRQETKISWMRDMPLSTAQEVIDKFKNHRIIQIRRDDQPALSNAEQFKGNLRQIMLLIRYSNKRLFIDSVCQHIASALQKKSTVVWVRNDPSILGYSMHDNIVTSVEDEIDTLSGSFLEAYDFTGNIYQCPFKEGTKLFESEDIVKSLLNQNN